MRLGHYFGTPSGRPRARLLQLPDALHAGPERPRLVPARHVLRRRQEFDVVAVSFDPRDDPADAAAKKKAYVATSTGARRRGRAGTS